jgi:hypothetical protein
MKVSLSGRSHRNKSTVPSRLEMKQQMKEQIAGLVAILEGSRTSETDAD